MTRVTSAIDGGFTQSLRPGYAALTPRDDAGRMRLLAIALAALLLAAPVHARTGPVRVAPAAEAGDSLPLWIFPAGALALLLLGVIAVRRP